MNVLGGKADWVYDEELDCHVPSCSQMHGLWRCGNGPLEGEQLLTGDCGGTHAVLTEDEAAPIRARLRELR